MTTIRLPFVRFYPSAGGETDREHVRIDGYVELTPAHIAQIKAAMFPPVLINVEQQDAKPVDWNGGRKAVYPEDAKPSLILNPHGPPAVGNGAGSRMEDAKSDADEAEPNWEASYHQVHQRAESLRMENEALRVRAETREGELERARQNADKALAELADLRQRYDALHDQRHEEARKADRARAELAAERAQMADYVRRAEDDIGFARKQRDEQRAEADKLSADLAAATEKAEKALQCHGDVPCGACITCLNGLLSEALAAHHTSTDQSCAARADADALAEALWASAVVMRTWAKIAADEDLNAYELLKCIKDNNEALAAHDARRGK